MPGSVSLSLDANGEPENFYADGIAYYVINNNMGYEGDLELALIPESFRTDVLKETLDTNGVLIENSNAEIVAFALLFEFDGDQRHIRHVLYNCSASRPGIEGKTNEDSKEVQTETLSIKATPLSDGKVKAKTGNTTNATAYNSWYNAVYLPQKTADATLKSLTIGSLTLTPTFDPDITEYTATTTNATNMVSAAPYVQTATVAITVNDETISSGSDAPWKTGKNSVVIVVTNGSTTKTYTITVTKEE
jgi:phi13 family phage major tail protein